MKIYVMLFYLKCLCRPVLNISMEVLETTLIESEFHEFTTWTAKVCLPVSVLKNVMGADEANWRIIVILHAPCFSLVEICVPEVCLS